MSCDRGIHGRACDVRDESAVEALADFAAQRMGGLDLWINNAGCSQARKAPLVDTPAETIKVMLRREDPAVHLSVLTTHVSEHNSALSAAAALGGYLISNAMYLPAVGFWH